MVSEQHVICKMEGYGRFMKTSGNSSDRGTSRNMESLKLGKLRGISMTHNISCANCMHYITHSATRLWGETKPLCASAWSIT